MTVSKRCRHCDCPLIVFKGERRSVCFRCRDASRRATDAAYRSRNRERTRAKNKAYYEKNKQRLLAAQVARYEAKKRRDAVKWTRIRLFLQGGTAAAKESA